MFAQVNKRNRYVLMLGMLKMKTNNSRVWINYRKHEREVAFHMT